MNHRLGGIDILSLEMLEVIDLARRLPVIPFKLWEWYQEYWKEDVKGFVREMERAQLYAESEGLLFEEVALKWLTR